MARSTILCFLVIGILLKNASTQGNQGQFQQAVPVQQQGAAQNVPQQQQQQVPQQQVPTHQQQVPQQQQQQQQQHHQQQQQQQQQVPQQQQQQVPQQQQQQVPQQQRQVPQQQLPQQQLNQQQQQARQQVPQQQQQQVRQQVPQQQQQQVRQQVPQQQQQVRQQVPQQQQQLHQVPPGVNPQVYQQQQHAGVPPVQQQQRGAQQPHMQGGAGLDGRVAPGVNPQVYQAPQHGQVGVPQHQQQQQQQQVQYVQVPQYQVHHVDQQHLQELQQQYGGNVQYLELSESQLNYLNQHGQLPPDVALDGQQAAYLQQHGVHVAPGQPPIFIPTTDAYGGDDKWKGDFDGMPGIAHDLRVGVDARKTSCFYQWYPKGAHVYMTFIVLRGGDRKVGFSLRAPTGTVMQHFQWESNKDFDFPVEVEGDYEMCLDNSFSNFQNKLVQLYMSGFVEHEFQKYSQEIEAMDVQVDNFTSTMNYVTQAVQKVREFQMHSRNNEVRDWYVLESNYKYVTGWSVAQCCVILATAFFQTYFVRKLFNVKNVTPTSKPRA